MPCWTRLLQQRLCASMRKSIFPRPSRIRKEPRQKILSKPASPALLADRRPSRPGRRLTSAVNAKIADEVTGGTGAGAIAGAASLRISTRNPPIAKPLRDSWQGSGPQDGTTKVSNENPPDGHRTTNRQRREMRT